MATLSPFLVRRTSVFLNPNRARVLVRPFFPTTEQRAVKIIARVIALPEEEVDTLLGQVLRDFAERHHKIRELFIERFNTVRSLLLTDKTLSENRQLLIGAYFTHEYALESAALFNPSVVPHPDQSDLPAGSLRFLLSLRATGEGHISSITFRTGIVDAHHAISINEPTRYVVAPQHLPNTAFEKPLFLRKLTELSLATDFAQQVMATLKEVFTLDELRTSLDFAKRQPRGRDADAVVASRALLALALNNYEVQFTPDQHYSERVIFPSSPSQSNGIEDARFVLFRDDDGTKTYYATYTAYDGKVTFPQLVSTEDFLRFRFITLNGPAVANKGMALFPRKINGHYAMLSRQDNENIFLMYSDQLHFWYEPELLLKPTYPWEFVQLGNCGSPIETEAGWLVLSHGVGAMRKYSIGAFLLDRNDPRKVIGRLREPLLAPDEHEREGYVPNVVYSCGALIHDGQLVLPYAVSDYSSRFALVDLKQLLDQLKSSP